MANLKAPKCPFEINWPLASWVPWQSFLQFTCKTKAFPSVIKQPRSIEKKKKECESSNKNQVKKLSHEEPKGGLIPEGFSIWLQSPKKCAQIYPDHLLFRWIELMILWTHFFGDWSQREKLSEIIQLGFKMRNQMKIRIWQFLKKHPSCMHL